uniref:Uncharacterized protein n=1 Tax=Arundo donax TaxID=35708 RepID=A0A0A9EB99_ARUDO
MRKKVCFQNIAPALVAEELMQTLEDSREPKKMAGAGPHRCPPVAGAAPSAARCKKRPATATELAPGEPCRRGSPQTAVGSALEWRAWQKKQAAPQN